MKINSHHLKFPCCASEKITVNSSCQSFTDTNIYGTDDLSLEHVRTERNPAILHMC